MLASSPPCLDGATERCRVAGVLRQRRASRVLHEGMQYRIADPDSGEHPDDRGNRFESVRDPHRVDVHREAAAGVAGVAVAPAGCTPMQGVTPGKADEI